MQENTNKMQENTSPATELVWPTLAEFRGYQSVNDRKLYTTAKWYIIREMKEGADQESVLANNAVRKAIIQDLVALGFWVKARRSPGCQSTTFYWSTERPRFARLRRWHGPYRYARLIG